MILKVYKVIKGHFLRNRFLDLNYAIFLLIVLVLPNLLLLLLLLSISYEVASIEITFTNIWDFRSKIFLIVHFKS